MRTQLPRRDRAKVSRTAHRPAKPSPTNRWDVIMFAIDNNPRTVRLCLILLVVGAVLLVAAALGLRLWL
jgi:hypothetical protein